VPLLRAIPRLEKSLSPACRSRDQGGFANVVDTQTLKNASIPLFQRGTYSSEITCQTNGVNFNKLLSARGGEEQNGNFPFPRLIDKQSQEMRQTGIHVL